MLILELMLIFFCIFSLVLFDKYIFKKNHFKSTDSHLILRKNGEDFDIEQAISTAIHIKNHYYKNLRITVVLGSSDTYLKRKFEKLNDITLEYIEE